MREDRRRVIRSCVASNVELNTLLSRWRSECGVSQTWLAEAIGKVKGAVSQYENGRITAGAEVVGSIDAALGADGVLIDLAFALRTPESLRPARTWRHNFEPGGGPVWAWVRAAGAVRVVSCRFGWGPARVAVTEPAGADGVIVTSPLSVPNPAVTVDLEQPGWVDFGRGVPPSWLPIPVVDAGHMVQPSSQQDYTLRLVSDRLRQVLIADDRSTAELAAFLGYDVDVLQAVVGRTRERPDPFVRPRPAMSRQPPSGARLQTIRTGRGMSRDDVVRGAARHPGAAEARPVTEDRIRAAENGTPSFNGDLLARLDMVYRCDGELTYQALGTASGEGLSITFPSYWTGPVWLSFQPLEKPELDVILRWDRLLRPIKMTGPTSVTCRKSSLPQCPLEVAHTSLPCVVTFGIGKDATAVDVNDAWQSGDRYATEELFEDVLKGIAALAGRSTAELAAFLPSLAPVLLPQKSPSH